MLTDCINCCFSQETVWLLKLTQLCSIFYYQTLGTSPQKRQSPRDHILIYTLPLFEASSSKTPVVSSLFLTILMTSTYVVLMCFSRQSFHFTASFPSVNTPFAKLFCVVCSYSLTQHASFQLPLLCTQSVSLTLAASPSTRTQGFPIRHRSKYVGLLRSCHSGRSPVRACSRHKSRVANPRI